MKCWDCEYFKIIQEPLRCGKDIYDLGRAECTNVCTETYVGDDYIFDQDFNTKADRKTENSSEKPNNSTRSILEQVRTTEDCSTVKERSGE